MGECGKEKREKNARRMDLAEVAYKLYMQNRPTKAATEAFQRKPYSVTGNYNK